MSATGAFIFLFPPASSVILVWPYLVYLVLLSRCAKCLGKAVHTSTA